MSYEKFRNDITDSLVNILPIDTLQDVLYRIDVAAASYDIHAKSSDIMVVNNNDVPQIVMLHVSAKAVENKSKHTLYAKLIILRNFFRSVRIPFDQITANDIRAYLYQYKLNRNVTDSTLDAIRRNIHGFFKWCVDEEYISSNPAAKVCAIKFQQAERRPLSMIELETLRSACVTLREKAVIDLLFCSGCRVSELCSLERGDVNMAEQTIMIRHGKGDKRRISYLNAESVISLHAYLDSRNDNDPALFASERKRQGSLGLTPGAIQKLINKIADRSSLGFRVHPHLFRHTAATRALEAGMPIEQVQQFLGHAKLDTTLIYTKINNREVQASHRKYIA